METTIVYWGNTRITEENMETTVLGYIGLGIRVKGEGLRVHGLGIRV